MSEINSQSEILNSRGNWRELLYPPFLILLGDGPLRSDRSDAALFPCGDDLCRFSAICANQFVAVIRRFLDASRLSNASTGASRNFESTLGHDCIPASSRCRYWSICLSGIATARRSSMDRVYPRRRFHCYVAISCYLEHTVMSDFLLTLLAKREFVWLSAD